MQKNVFRLKHSESRSEDEADKFFQVSRRPGLPKQHGVMLLRRALHSMW